MLMIMAAWRAEDGRDWKHAHKKCTDIKEIAYHGKPLLLQLFLAEYTSAKNHCITVSPQARQSVVMSSCLERLLYLAANTTLLL